MKYKLLLSKFVNSEHQKLFNNDVQLENRGEIDVINKTFYKYSVTTEEEDLDNFLIAPSLQELFKNKDFEDYLDKNLELKELFFKTLIGWEVTCPINYELRNTTDYEFLLKQLKENWFLIGLIDLKDIVEVYRNSYGTYTITPYRNFYEYLLPLNSNYSIRTIQDNNFIQKIIEIPENTRYGLLIAEKYICVSRIYWNEHSIEIWPLAVKETNKKIDIEQFKLNKESHKDSLLDAFKLANKLT